jgi:hypothetical protein
MVYNGLEYLITTIDSIMESDFPRDRESLVVSVDVDVSEYLFSLTKEVPHLIKFVHPFHVMITQIPFPDMIHIE